MANDSTSNGLTLYECHNKNCELGSRSDHGRFTDGMTPEHVSAVTGKPIETLVEGEDYGSGLCPSCGVLGKKVGEHLSVVGDDPYDDFHKAVDANLRREDSQGNVTGVIHPEDTREVLAKAIEILDNDDRITHADTAVEHAIEEVYA